MARLVIEVMTGHRTQGGYHRFDAGDVLVGRGLTNDLILNDPYVSEHHLRISQQEEGILIQDLSTKNGTYVPRLHHTATTAVIASGDEIVVGMTRLRVFVDSHKVHPARTLHQRNVYMSWMRKPAVAWCTVAAALGLALFEGYLETDTPTTLVELLPHPIMVFVVVLLWAGAWCFVGRLTRHKIRFFIHLSSICVTLILGALLEQTATAIGFYLNSPMLQELLGYAVWVGLSATLLYTAFSFATNMRHATKMIASGACTILCLAALVGLFASYRHYYFTGAIPYGKTLKPPFLAVPSGRTIDEFLLKTDRVFEFRIAEAHADQEPD